MEPIMSCAAEDYYNMGVEKYFYSTVDEFSILKKLARALLGSANER